ncbi:MAG: hypothetical protein MH825_07695 [Cyanobacteria bacterium]|nr:hypothetical protein [Cyanobacteriota bacterium]
METPDEMRLAALQAFVESLELLQKTLTEDEQPPGTGGTRSPEPPPEADLPVDDDLPLGLTELEQAAADIERYMRELRGQDP